ncbi:NUDIX hydrolase [Kineococcus sp. SYSU DK006]|uniref:NUDIX hydrolase n=1 Tax=Kineococcus sp. SYSU DK006 TaxID=3383127 RepID=UPI003D7D458F
MTQDLGQRPALQRVVVHVAVRTVRGAPAGGVLLDAAGVLPHAVLAHGETPAAAARRAVGLPVVTGAVLAVDDGVRRAAVPAGGVEAAAGEDGVDEVDVHSVHVVLAADLPSSPEELPPPLRWAPVPGGWPLAADADVAVEQAELARSLPPADPRTPVVRQRLACYAVVLGDDALLLTRLSPLTPSPGRWTLPGGGVDHGEHPLAAVVREVHEETGMDVEVDGLADIAAEHFTGRSPRGVLEDFHAVRILVTATPLQVREPEVLDVGGSTDLARWVPLAEAESVGLVAVAHRGLQIALAAQRAG